MQNSVYALYQERGDKKVKNENHNKVKIFISSKCDGENLEDLKYGVMRKALALLLEDTS